MSLVKGKKATTLKKEKGDEDEGKKLLIPITSPLITAKRDRLALAW